MLFSILMLIRKHPIMFLIGLYSPLAVVIGLVFYEPSIPVRDFVMLGIFSSVMGAIFLPAMFTFIIFMSCFIERGLDRKWLELGLRYAHEANGDGRDAHADKAAKYFMKSALLFDDAAIVNLGLCYACGFGVEKDPRKAAKCYRVAAEKKKNDYEFCNGDRNMAQLALGLCYADGIGVERDKIKAEDLFCKAGPSFGLLQRIWNPEEVVMWLREAGKRENAFAQCQLGDYYWSKKDYAEAIKWYCKAAEQGNAYAQTALGNCYHYGNGVGKDETEAVKWYRKAAEQGNTDGQVALGKCYRAGTGVEKDEVEAVQLFRKAAEQGNAEAQISLAACYLDGVGVGKDEPEAIRWFHRAAKQDDNYFAKDAKQYLKAIEDGDPEAQFDLAGDYECGRFFVENKAEAVKWYRKSAEQGNADAQNALGNCYHYGNGVGKDETEAVKWYRKAVEQGNAYAQTALGECYCYGIGVEKNEIEAVQLFRKAAEQGNAEAQILLASCYLSGTGVAKDEAEAIVWFRRAAQQDGFFDSYYAEIAKQHLKAVEDSDSEAQCRLALAYKIGLVCIKNEVEAVKWYRKAAEQGNADAQAALGDSIGERKDDVSGWWYHMATVHGDAYVIKQLDEFLQESDEKN